MARPRRETEIGGSGRSFEPTAWTLVRGAQAHQARALEDLIRRYWKPVYFHIRRKGRPIESAKDLTRDFFCALLEKDHRL